MGSREHDEPIPSTDRLIGRFADGECRTESERARAEARLAGSPDARAELTEVERVGELVTDALEASPIGDGLAAQIKQAVRESARLAKAAPEPAPAPVAVARPASAPAASPIASTGWSPRAPQLAAAIAACAVVAFGLWMIDRRTPVPEGTPETALADAIGRWPGVEASSTLALRRGDQSARDAGRGATLRVGDELRNDGRIGTFLELDDGSRVALGPGASVRLVASDRVEMLGDRGRLFCEIARRRPGQRSFTIKARSTEVAVLGTRFTVDLDPVFARVSVFEGKVRVASPFESDVLTPSEASRVDEVDGRCHRVALDAVREIGWVPGYESYRPEIEPSGGPSDLGVHDGPSAPTGRPAAPSGDGSGDMPVLPPKRKDG